MIPIAGLGVGIPYGKGLVDELVLIGGQCLGQTIGRREPSDLFLGHNRKKLERKSAPQVHNQLNVGIKFGHVFMEAIAIAFCIFAHGRPEDVTTGGGIEKLT